MLLHADCSGLILVVADDELLVLDDDIFADEELVTTVAVRLAFLKFLVEMTVVVYVTELVAVAVLVTVVVWSG